MFFYINWYKSPTTSLHSALNLMTILYMTVCSANEKKGQSREIITAFVIAIFQTKQIIKFNIY